MGQCHLLHADHINTYQIQNIHYLNSATAKSLIKVIFQVKQVYMQRGFRVTNLLMDCQFGPLWGDLTSMQIALALLSNNEHSDDIERLDQTVKERYWDIFNTLPYLKLPNRMVIGIVHFCIFWLNIFRPSHSILSNTRPCTLITGKTIDYNHHCKLECGEYVQTNEKYNNIITSQAVGAISLRPTSNIQGGYYFPSLYSGYQINYLQFAPPPPPPISTHNRSEERRVGRDG